MFLRREKTEKRKPLIKHEKLKKSWNEARLRVAE
jgi:hypothetical protein